MPTERRVALAGPPGHVDVLVREWDYDRAGGAYQIVCECEWQSQQHWSWAGVEEEYQKHLQSLLRRQEAAGMSDVDLAERVRQVVKHRIGTWGSEFLLEAAERLAAREAD